MKYSIIASFACVLVFCSSLICNAQIPLASLDVRDLENLAIVDSVRHNTLEKTLNHCHTKLGKDYFRQSLCHPSSNMQELEQCQAHLRHFVTNPELVFQISNLLRTCGEMEASIDIFSEYETARPLLDEFYFKVKPCTSLNKNTIALNVSFFLHYINLFAPLLEHVLLHVGIDAVFSSLTKKSHHKDHGHHHHHKHKGCACSHYSNLSSAMYYVAQAAHWGMHLPGYYEMMTHVQARTKKIEIAQSEIEHLKKYFDSVRSIYESLVIHNPEFIKNYTPTLAGIFEGSSNNAMATLVATLLGSSWKSSLQSTFNPGAILAMHAELSKHADVMHKIASEVGIIDAYSNISRWFLEKKAYCFVTFIENSSPSVSVEGLWHHAISAESMRPLTVALDGNNPCLLIRGANGSGKSTMLTALGQAVVLAQSWGIAPAENATITPFSHFYTHSLKRDAIEKGLSHFYYEHAYYEALKVEGSEGYTLLLLDEPYTCTDPEVGAGYLAALIENIKEDPKKMALIATHYNL